MSDTSKNRDNNGEAKQTKEILHQSSKCKTQENTSICYLCIISFIIMHISSSRVHSKLKRLGLEHCQNAFPVTDLERLNAIKHVHVYEMNTW